MKRWRVARLATGLMVCCGLVAAVGGQPVGAQAGEENVGAEAEEQLEEASESFELQPKFPEMSGPADGTFEFTVGLTYGGQKARVFDFNLSGPEGWDTFIAEDSYRKERRLSAMRLESYTMGEDVVVVAEAPYWMSPEPGEYTIELEAVSNDGELRDTAELTAKIDARYALSARTDTGRLDMKTTAGRESTLGVVVENTGSTSLDKVTFSSSKPQGVGDEEWRVKFDPVKIETLDAGEEREVAVAVQPPSEAIAGDYMVTLKFDGDPDLSGDPPDLEVRAAVSTPTMWGWVGVAIVLAAIGGVVVVFRQYGRR